MLFNSSQFMIFFPIVVLIYYIIPGKFKYLWLLAASYYFYMCWNVKYIILLLFSTVVTYASGIFLDRINLLMADESKQKKSKNLVVAMSFSLNLLLLFYFKYSNFALGSISHLFRMVHIELNVPAFDIILPVGISFYIFQALSYTMDVYRGEIYAERNIFKYALFVSFFPQLVAGPIERSKNLLKQLAEPKAISFEDFRDGLLLMLWGFFLKLVLADRIAIFVDAVYTDYETYAGWYLIVATMLFAVQIYCDFYGYSVIAMGAAEILGVRLMENFDAPYLSCSVAEFWRKWHISLTSWFKDYLYIPLGGSRKGTLRKYINKMIVFLVSGLWHGASFSYVIWGGLNGLYQVLGEMLLPVRNKIISLFGLHRETIAHKLFNLIVTFILVDFSWIFFRAASFSESFIILRQMICVKNPWILFDDSLYQCGLDRKNFGLMLICIGILLFADYCKHRKIKIREVIAGQDYWFRWITIVAAVCAILTFGIWGPNYDAANFIYFQF